jgi:hypothetical protein
MGYCSSTRFLLWLVAALMLLFACAAPGEEWIGWSVPLSLLVFLLIIDAMCVCVLFCILQLHAYFLSARATRFRPLERATNTNPTLHNASLRAHRFSNASDFVFDPSIKNYARSQACVRCMYLSISAAPKKPHAPTPHFPAQPILYRRFADS